MLDSPSDAPEKPLACLSPDEVIGATADRDLLPNVPKDEIAWKPFGLIDGVFGWRGMAKEILSLGSSPDGSADRSPFTPLRAFGPLGGIFIGVEERNKAELEDEETMIPDHREVIAVMSGEDYSYMKGNRCQAAAAR